MGKRIKRQNLPEEIILEILYNLPVKSLLKLKCVSKSWLFWISSPYFIKKHLEKSSTNTDFTRHNLILNFDQPLYCLRYCSLRSFLDEPKTLADSMITIMEYSTTTPNDLIKISGSCNGLILLTNNHSDLLMLWNPSTRKTKNVLPPQNRIRGLLPTVYGFGYDDLTDDYRVVCIYYFDLDLNHSLHVPYDSEIYSLRTDSWKKIEEFPKGYFPENEAGKFVNGRLHWLQREYANDSWGYANDSWGIVSIDMMKEKYEVVAKPDSFSDCDYHLLPTLTVLGGNLSLVCYDSGDMDVWIMKEYGVTESWIKTLTIPFYDQKIRYHEVMKLWSMRNEDTEVAFGSTIVFYGQRNKLLKCGVDVVNAIIEASVYVESLVSPFGDEEK